MPVFHQDGATLREVIPRFKNDGEITGDSDNLFAQTASALEHIYPDPADVEGGLVPVEDLAVSAGPDHHSVTIGWTNPAQPDVTPTNIQLRLPYITAIWDELDVSATGQAFEALDASTNYVAQVRYVRRVDGVVVATSVTRSVFFTTTAAPVGAPAPDPGGSGTDTVFPIGGSTGGTPSPPSTIDGCWWEWKIQIVGESTLDWIDTLITGEADGDADNISYDTAALSSARTYRMAIREACDTTGDGVADDWGEWFYGPAFPGAFDWDLACGGMANSALLGETAADDAIWAFPKSCTADGFPGTRIVDKVAGTTIQEGPDFAALYLTGTGEWGAVADSDGGVTMYAGLAAVEAVIGVPATDFTVLTQYRFAPSHTPDNGNQRVIAALGGGHVSVRVTETASGFIPSVELTMDGGVVTLVGTAITMDDDIHTIAVRWDADGDKDLFVDGILLDSDTSGNDWASGVTANTWYATGATGFGSNLQQIGWDRLLSDLELASLHYTPPDQIEWKMAQSQDIELPADIELNDIILWHGSAKTGGTTTGPPGFTRIGSNYSSPGIASIGLFYKIADGTEGGTTVTGSIPSSDRRILVGVIRNIDAASPFAGTPAFTASDTSPYELPGMTLTQRGLIVWFVFHTQGKDITSAPVPHVFEDPVLGASPGSINAFAQEYSAAAVVAAAGITTDTGVGSAYHWVVPLKAG